MSSFTAEEVLGLRAVTGVVTTPRESGSCMSIALDGPACGIIFCSGWGIRARIPDLGCFGSPGSWLPVPRDIVRVGSAKPYLRSHLRVGENHCRTAHAGLPG